MIVLGFDVGGSGIKAAPVDTETGEFTEERHRIETPQPTTPNEVARVVQEITRHFNWKGIAGCGFPAAVQNGIAKTAANIDKSWINTNVASLFSETTSCPFFVINDADSAAIAEMRFGLGKNRKGVVLMLTVGTGIGSAVFTDGKLLPNTEFGHIIMKGMQAEHYASDAVRKKENLKWKEWAERFLEYIKIMESYLYPDLIVLGGGISKKFHKYGEYLKTETIIYPAELKNHAGIIGAALYAKDKNTEGIK